jgi:valyl-tRNA synthetase
MDEKEPLAKAYEPRDVEARWYRVWEEQGLFRADPASGRPSFAIVIPPPNVTGELHIGHAFTLTLQDVIVRWRRMQGHDVLWLPGLDHAGIATQTVVEKQLAAEGKRKENLGRDGFLARVQQWKEQSGGRITQQLRAMGFSLDWSRERYTMDPGFSRAVREVFVRLYEDGLIYRGDYIVNWCPRCVTAISDLETETVTKAGHLWHIRYPEAGGGAGIVVATTRPETLLGDTGVAVHPDDERYKGLIGRSVVLPVLGRRIPVVADTFVDPAFGTGAVKLTPAHDANDFLAGQRLGLPSINIMDERAVLNDNAGPYAGQDRYAARKGIVAQLEAEGLLVKTEPHQVPLGRCQRCHTDVEPRLSLQWFLKMAPLAGPAIRAVEEGHITFVPESWSKTYFEWMRNIRDWCVSRQLWWGHRIPAWTCSACGELVVAREAPASCPKCGGASLVQEDDVLDTWFSSGLFPFATLGWPEKTADLQRYYPNHVMMTGFDIIFFWVARMVVFGLRFGGDVPFRTVFINGLVRDEKGQKMSKTRGNVADPLGLVAEHGADALRFTLSALAAPGVDPSLSLKRLEGYQAFVNKLWNASRFLLMNLEGERAAPGSFVVAGLPLPMPSRWILARLDAVAGQVNAALEAFRFDQAANAIYHFVWDEFCDWYVEIAKVYLADPAEAPRARAVLLEVLESSLRLLHPFIPFVTEEIWQRLPHDGPSIMVARYPEGEARGSLEDEMAMAEMKALVTGIRTSRTLREVDPRRRINIVVAGDNFTDKLRMEQDWVRALARLDRMDIVRHLPADTGDGITEHIEGWDFVVEQDKPDVAAQTSRLTKTKGKLEAELEGLQKKLENTQFVARANPDVVTQARTRVAELENILAKLKLELQALRPPQ